jgi:hypothetical protein
VASQTFNIKQNDTSPALEAYLRDSRGRAVNLTGATVVFHMRLQSSGEAKITDGSVTLTTATQGLVSYSFTAANTDTSGIYQAEFQVTFSGGAIETFPNDDYIKVVVTDDVA